MTRLVFVSIFAAYFVSLSAGCASSPTDTDRKTSGKPALVLMTDFGLRDGAVSAMKGVAHQTAPGLLVSDLTHEIPNYSIWDAAYRLQQTFLYWPAGTVFVTVVDPGVGSERKSVVVKTNSGHYFVGPDNGLTTLVSDQVGVAAVTQIDEARQRLKGSEDSYTFHGRDLYVYVGARLASGLVRFEELGAQSEASKLVRLEYQKPEFLELGTQSTGQLAGQIVGGVPVLDPQFGNVWTNIPKALVESKLLLGPASQFRVQIFKKEVSADLPKRLPPKQSSRQASQPKQKPIFDQVLPLGATFAAVPKGRPLLYFNSLLNVSLAINQGDFAKKYGIGSGPEWTVSISPHRISR
ncbi:MAG: S-adenosyl-l-methionine hydroxide adenosyltransferase family protein [Bdellovibrionales bacterium]|nr:S-adenosyl-l-methionine hydroxide adenosyltransferase family protein [Bdellovibrionales bacterium]